MTRSVPELSLKAFTHGDAGQRAAFSDAMMRGLQDYGFFVLKDHGVPLELLQRAYAEAEGLFALPEATKRQYAKGMRGYTPFGVEHAKDSGHPDLKEFWQVGHDPSPEAPADEPFEPNVWPAEAPGVQAASPDGASIRSDQLLPPGRVEEKISCLPSGLNRGLLLSNAGAV